MTQHSSLKNASVGVRHRNVLKRHERIGALQKAEKWRDRDSAHKLPKMKLLKIKVKKSKSKAEGEAGAEGAEKAPAAAQQTTASKPAAKTAAK